MEGGGGQAGVGLEAPTYAKKIQKYFFSPLDFVFFWWYIW
jgi:hypothetical protein